MHVDSIAHAGNSIVASIPDAGGQEGPMTAMGPEADIPVRGLSVLA